MDLKQFDSVVEENLGKEKESYGLVMNGHEARITLQSTGIHFLANDHEEENDIEQKPTHLTAAEGLPIKIVKTSAERKQGGLQSTIDRTEAIGKSFKCQICEKLYYSFSMLKLHYESLHPTYCHLCNVCAKPFQSPAEFKTHMKEHSETDRFACHICMLRFSKKCDLQTHTMSFHQVDGVTLSNSTAKTHPVQKNKCQNMSTDYINQLDSNALKLPYKCNFCFNAFSAPSKLSSHIRRIHSDQNPYQCSVCTATFPEIDELTGHMQSHSTELPFACDKCSARFADKAHNETHQNTHFEFDQMKCQDCGMLFTDGLEYKAHIDTHNGESPFSCYICSKEFGIRKNLHKHIKYHTGLVHILASII